MSNKLSEEEFNKLSENDKLTYMIDHPEEFSGREYHKIEVPPGIRYISDWPRFSIPDRPHIMNKSIPGCGFTEYCLTNNENVVLCSPRKILLQNKYDQHIKKGDHILLIKTKYDLELNTDKDLTKTKPDSDELTEYLDKIGKIDPKDYKDTYELVSKQIGEYISYCQSVRRPVKILVTYDSFLFVKQSLLYFDILDNFRIVVDEFTSIFTDSRFKSDTELTFVKQLQGIQRLCYLSATPMMENYLNLVEEFKDLPYYELDWGALDPLRIIKPNLKVRTVKSIISKGKEIIKSYLDGNYAKFFFPDGSYRESKECVIYVNSVNNICSLVRGMGLTPDQVNILVANTEPNKKLIHKRIGKNFNIGKVPRKDEPNKMFTLCTRTVYLGADFYSDNARSFILSDANIETLAVDISLDLPQIMGRQRMIENPWKNEGEFYYRSLTDGNSNRLGKLDFDNFMNKKRDITKKLLISYQNANNADSDSSRELAKRYKMDSRTYSYKHDYVAVDKDEDGNLQPVENKLVIIAEKRAFDIQSIDYQDRFSVFNSISDSLYSEKDAKEIQSELNKFFKKYTPIKNNIREVLRLFCESELSDTARDRIYELLSSKVKSYLSLGSKKLKSVDYIPEKVNNLLTNQTINIDDIIYSKYQSGDKLVKSDLKKDLQNIYDKSGLSKKAKATDIEEWFNTSNGQKTINGKRVHLIILVDKKK